MKKAEKEEFVSSQERSGKAKSGKKGFASFLNFSILSYFFSPSSSQASATHSQSNSFSFEDEESAEIIDFSSESEPSFSNIKKSSTLGVKLDSLIARSEYLSLWQKTLGDEFWLSVRGNRFSEQSQFPWHSKQSLLEFKTTLLSLQLQALANSEMKLLRELFDEMLSPAFQQYGALIELDDSESLKAMSAFYHYAQRCMEGVMLCFTEDTKSKRYSAQSMVFDDELFHFKVEALHRIQPLCFHRAKQFKPPFNIILPFIVARINVERYEALLKELEEKTALAALCAGQSKQAINQLALTMQKGAPPADYIALSGLFFSFPILSEPTIKALSEALHYKRHLYRPTCAKDESDFYIPLNSLLHKALETKIESFINKHKKDEECSEDQFDAKELHLLAIDLSDELLEELTAEKYIDDNCSISLLEIA
ncbi:hypothetical protein BN59_00361 [Legionella massiliensis]|uniref:Uncharacterized protein n=1 Tax=Legionella massiliensis TaxID=1034943 RepID=A0A078KT21_9GAMM|nr:hypothetical protein [Legionella massiliensis]CDZ76097.1 hypothetical protein BN59_00361 [Legionella massiliensis]CEE11835.1 hypothetical protein BN1094_00361 [Legionella massiliensis]